MTFVVLRDRSGLVQVVAKDSDVIASLGELPEETVVEVTGRVVHNPAAPGGAELVEPVFTPLTEPALPPPAELWRPTFGAGLPTQLDHAAVTLRHPRHRAAWEIASASMRGFRSALGSLEFTEIVTPKLVGTATESGANVFTVDYFGQPAYLAQSPQLYKQMLVGVFERVFEVGPVFRAEPHDTVRHLAQYTSLDAELGFIRDHRDVLAVLRAALLGMVQSIRTYAAEAASLLGVDLPRVPEEFPVIHFRDALATVGADPDEPDLSPAHERALSAWARAEFDSDFLAVEGYPMAKRPFYTHPWGAPPPMDPPRTHPWGAPPPMDPPKTRVAESAETPWGASPPMHPPKTRMAEPGADGFQGSNSFDLLFRGLELTTGGQRLHRPSDYAAALQRAGQSPERARGIPRRVPARDAAPWRVRDRARALGGPPDRRREHPRGHPLPPGPDPARTIGREDEDGGRRGSELSGIRDHFGPFWSACRLAAVEMRSHWPFPPVTSAPKVA